MKHTAEDLEKEMASLQPVTPSEILEAKIEQSLRGPKTSKPKAPIGWFPLAAWAATACVAMTAAIILISPAPKEDAAPTALANNESGENLALELSDYEPVEAEHRLTKAIDEGVFLNAQNEPLRKFRYQFVDSFTLVNQTDGSVFTMELPREEVLLVPVSLH